MTHIVGRPKEAPDLDPRLPCVEWDGELDKDGYGRSGSGRSHSQVAHVMVWEEAFGELPRGTSLDHVCMNRACIRLEHLDLVEWAENSRRRWDGRRKGDR